MTRAPRYRHEHPPVIHKPDMTLRLAWRLTLLVGLMLLGFVLAFLIGMFFVRNTWWQRPVIRWWLSALVRLLNLDVRIDGEPVEHSALWISNHVSWMDIPVLGSLRPLQFLSKAEVAKWPLIGTLAQAAGTLFIQRGSGDSGLVIRQICAELDAGRRVLFFPEGTTTDGFTVKRLFAKLFAAASESQCLIQPMVICYQREDGHLHPLAPFIGDDEMGAHLMQILAGERIQVIVHVLPSERAGLRTPAELATHFEHVFRHALGNLHGAELPPDRTGLAGIKAA